MRANQDAVLRSWQVSFDGGMKECVELACLKEGSEQFYAAVVRLSAACQGVTCRGNVMIFVLRKERWARRQKHMFENDGQQSAAFAHAPHAKLCTMR